jgi:hypothetical protein
MTNDEFKNLKPGDMVAHKDDSRMYIVFWNFGNRVTAVAAADMTNPDEWDLKTKVRFI